MPTELTDTPTRGTNADETRERILEVTVELLDQHGDHRLRLADVARGTGVAVSTIYAHFRDRSDLVAHARLTRFRLHTKAVLDQLNHDGHPRTVDELRGLVQLKRSLDPDDPEWSDRRWDRIEVFADARHIEDLSDSVAELQDGLTVKLTELLRSGQELGAVDPAVDPAALAMMIQSMRLGLSIWDRSGDARPDPEAWSALVDRVILALAPGLAEDQPGRV